MYFLAFKDNFLWSLCMNKIVQIIQMILPAYLFFLNNDIRRDVVT